MGITFSQKGDFKKVNSFLEKCLEVADLGFLDKYGRKGVEALEAATPRDTGLAASSWNYRIERSKGTVVLSWYNEDIENGFNVAMALQMGHATKSGTWVEGIDYINPAMRPIFDEILDQILKEVR